ncbi:uncharacterized protein M6B38_340260 [Iris pallida]|uniref:Uncharacterized protein n=1 Tax=Iris pallida TaxID=29817 RepID=A0AAX6GXX6_IRIPA|nr:uncharacterized protein M6B38_340260 [Iris pallida]
MGVDARLVGSRGSTMGGIGWHQPTTRRIARRGSSATTRKCGKFAAECGRTGDQARRGRLGTARRTQVLEELRPSAALARNWTDRSQRTWVRTTTAGCIRKEGAARGSRARGARRSGPSAVLQREAAAQEAQPERTQAWAKRAGHGSNECGGARSPDRPEKSTTLGQCTDSEVRGGI